MAGKRHRSQKPPSIGKPVEAPPHAVRYPWNDWLSRPEGVTLHYGVHYQCQDLGLARAAQYQASRRGIRLFVRIRRGKVFIRNKTLRST